MTVPGPPASVLAAILRANATHPYSAADRRQRRMAWFSQTAMPDLPSLITEGVFLPANATFDANVSITGYLASQGWGTQGVTSVAANYVTAPSDAVVLADATAGAVTVALGDATQSGWISPGQRVTVIKTDTSANDVTVTGSNGQKIGGSASLALSGANAYTSAVFDGANWQIWAGYVTVGTAPSGAAGGDLGGSYPNPTVVSTHLASPMPLTQGGTGNVSGQPSGAAGGDLAGTYPNPSVAALNGVAISGTPALGKVPMANSASGMTWETHPVDWVNPVSEYGAAADAAMITDAAMTSGSATLTSASAGFTAADVGKTITVLGAGASGALLAAAISGYTNSTTVTLSATASTTVSGATATYGTDDTAAIQNALNAAGALAIPGVCFIPAGAYLTSAPLLIPAGVRVIGDKGTSTSAYDSLPPSAGTVIRPSGSFTAGSSPAGVIVLNGMAVHMEDLWVDGTTLPASITGVTAASGGASAIYLSRVGVYNATNMGFDQVGTAWHLDRCQALTCYDNGFHGTWIDSILIGCHAQVCGYGSLTGSGFYIYGGESKFISCRADTCQYGFSIDAPLSSTYFDPIILTGCSTQRCNFYGYRIKNGSTGGTAGRVPVVVAGCMSTSDGVNGTIVPANGGSYTGAAGGGGYAAVGIQGSQEVLIAGFANSVATRDAPSGCPQYGIATYGSGTPDVISVSASFFNGVTAVADWAVTPDVAQISASSGYAGGIYQGAATTRPVAMSGPWMAMTLGTGWAARGAGFAAPEYTLEDGKLILAGEVVGTSVANASTIATLPAGYYSATDSFTITVSVSAGAAAPTAGQTFRLSLNTSGQLQFYGVATTGNYTVSLDGIVIPITAA